MTPEQYIGQFDFSPIEPTVPMHPEASIFLHHYPELLVHTEKWNTRFPDDHRGVQSDLERISKMPRLSTLAIGRLINEIVSNIPRGQAYVNVGVWHGYSLCAAFPKNEDAYCIGIDNFTEFGGPRTQCTENFQKFRGSEKHQFFDMDYREYFKKHTLPIGFYYYDGEHSYKNQLQGLEIAEPFLAPGAIIMVDDTNWPDPRNATLEFMRRHPDQYEIIADLKTACDRHLTWWNGVMVLRKKG